MSNQEAGNEANILVSTLRQYKQRIAVVESVTGGMIASAIIAVEGASDVIEEAFVMYSDRAKVKFGVDAEVLVNHQTVSETTALSLLQALHHRTGTQLLLSTTGIAGPSGGTADTPVGTVCFGFMILGKTKTITKKFAGHRNQIRQSATTYALMAMTKLIREEYEHGSSEIK